MALFDIFKRNKQIFTPVTQREQELKTLRTDANLAKKEAGKSLFGRTVGEIDDTILKGIKGVAKGAKNLFSDTITYKAPEEEKPTTFRVPDRPVDVQEDELDELGGVIFGEANNDINEMRMIANVVLNRANQSNKSILQELTKRSRNGGFEFNAYSGNQYNKYRSGDFDFVSQKKADLVNQVLQEIRNGQLRDNTEGAVFFSHDKDGRIATTTDLYENIRHAGN